MQTEMQKIEKEIEKKQMSFGEMTKTFKQNLKDRGVKSFCVEYSGSGDSGQIDEIGIVPEKLQKKTILSKNYRYWDEKKMQFVKEDKKIPLSAYVEDYCYDLLEHNNSGWEINDGQSGEISWNSEDNNIEHKYTQYYTEHNNYEEEF